jgi:hypothetical protein
METSKLILIVVSVITISVIVYTFFITWITKDLSALVVLIPSVFTEAAASTGFYYNKAKSENQIKLKKIYGVESVSEEEVDQ